jgi:hypothetical protein
MTMDWEAQYEAGEMPWDEGAAHPALVDFIAAEGEFQGRVLIPGCGQGHDVRAVSSSASEVIGLDIAPAAVERARIFPRRAREEYIVGDLFRLAGGLRGSFDWVVEHTCFCAIDPSMRPGYPGAVAGALKPGGLLFAIFYLDPAQERQPPFGVTKRELDDLFSPRFAVVREWVPARTFEDREKRELVRILRCL